MSFDGVRVKEEAEWASTAGEGDASAAVRTALFDGHELKEEPMVGPQLLKPPDATRGAYVCKMMDDMEMNQIRGQCQPSKVKLEPEDIEIAEHGVTEQPACKISGDIKADIGVVRHFANDENNDFKICERKFVHGSVMRRMDGRALEQTDPKTSTDSENVEADSETEAYVCDMCNQSYKLKLSLIRHIKCHQQQALSGHARADMREDSYRCDVCNKTFTSKSRLADHGRVHKRNKLYTCKSCNKQFMYKSNFVNHNRIHTGEKPFSCKICNKHFRWKTCLNIHSQIHTGEKPFGCKICNKRFGQKWSLNVHGRIHTGEKPFGCKICNKRFGQKWSLDVHGRIHTAEKPFSCKICNKRFKLKSSLNLHSQIHTGERPYGCKICNKRFRLKGSLNAHTRIHAAEKPFSCKICNMRFRYKTHLKLHDVVHGRTHSEEKLYSCKVCNMQFYGKSFLTGHIEKIHSGEELPLREASMHSNLVTYERLRAGAEFSCDICKKQFTRQSNLTQHMQLLHAGAV